MIKTWEWVKKGFVAVGLFIAGFFLIRRGIDTSEVSGADELGKAKQGELEAKSELEKVKKEKDINKNADDKKKKLTQDLKKKSKNSKVEPKKKKKNSQDSQKKTPKNSRKLSKKGSR